MTLAFLLVWLTLLGGVGGRLLVEHRRVTAAADLTALSAATAVQHGRSACTEARELAALHGARLEGCRVAAETVTVEVAATVELPMGLHTVVRGRARAGPR